MRLPLCLACALLAAPALARDLPPRKPGLWAMTWQHERDTQPLTLRQCVDPATDAALDPLGTPGAKCSAAQLDEAGATVERSCESTGKTIAMRGALRGSFDSAYTIQFVMRGTFTASGMDIGRDGPVRREVGDVEEIRTTLDAKWLGACPADQTPGDITGDFDSKENIVDMLEREREKK